VIKEEDEDAKHFDEKFKKVLEIKSKYVIWNDDEEADKPYIPKAADYDYKIKEKKVKLSE